MNISDLGLGVSTLSCLLFVRPLGLRFDKNGLSYKQTKIDWELKKKIILFLQKTQSVEAYDAMTPNQIAHRAAQFIENILNSKLPPKLAIPLELQVTTREPD